MDRQWASPLMMGSLGQRHGGQRKRVEQQVLRRGGQRIEGALHRPVGSLDYTQPVDFLARRHANLGAKRFSLDDGCQLLPLWAGEGLAVPYATHPGAPGRVREDYRAGDDGPGDGAPAHLIEPGNTGVTGGEQGGLFLEVRDRALPAPPFDRLRVTGRRRFHRGGRRGRRDSAFPPPLWVPAFAGMTVMQGSPSAGTTAVTPWSRRSRRVPEHRPQAGWSRCSRRL